MRDGGSEFRRQGKSHFKFEISKRPRVLCFEICGRGECHGGTRRAQIAPRSNHLAHLSESEEKRRQAAALQKNQGAA